MHILAQHHRSPHTVEQAVVGEYQRLHRQMQLRHDVHCVERAFRMHRQHQVDMEVALFEHSPLDAPHQRPAHRVEQGWLLWPQLGGDLCHGCVLDRRHHVVHEVGTAALQVATHIVDLAPDQLACNLIRGDAFDAQHAGVLAVAR
ncbi:hypothetical protein D3C85_1275050 [compost metagenome]